MSKHEARTSLLSGSTLDQFRSTSPYPAAYRGRGYSSADSYTNERYPVTEPEYTIGGYHQREGYAVGNSKLSKQTSWTYWPSSRWQWGYIIGILVQAGIGLALEWFVARLSTTKEADADIAWTVTYLPPFRATSLIAARRAHTGRQYRHTFLSSSSASSINCSLFTML